MSTLHTVLTRTKLADGSEVEFTYNVYNVHPDKVRQMAIDAAWNDNPTAREVATSTITRIWE